MYKCYGITKAVQPTGIIDAVCQRAAQTRRIRRFCVTNDISLSGNCIVTTDPRQDLYIAMNLYESGWLDYVVVISRDVLGNDKTSFDAMFKALDEKKAVIVLDECSFY